MLFPSLTIYYLYCSAKSKLQTCSNLLHFFQSQSPWHWWSELLPKFSSATVWTEIRHAHLSLPRSYNGRWICNPLAGWEMTFSSLNKPVTYFYQLRPQPTHKTPSGLRGPPGKKLGPCKDKAVRIRPSTIKLCCRFGMRHHLISRSRILWKNKYFTNKLHFLSLSHVALSPSHPLTMASSQ